MNLTSISSNYFINYMSVAGRMNRSNTARSLAKQLMKDIELPGSKDRTGIEKQLEQINKGIQALNQPAKSSETDYRIGMVKNSAVSDYNSRITGLINSSDALTDTGRKSILKEAGINSTDSRVAELAASRTISSGSRGFELKVDALAKNQISALNAVSGIKDSLSEDTGFSIRIGDKKHDFSSVAATGSAPKSKLQSLNELSKQVNDAKLGIKADVEVKNDSAVLKLSADRTGEKNVFSVEAFKGMLDSASLSQKAQNAVYSIKSNGFEQKFGSESNEISIGYNGVKAVLKAEGTTKISFDGINKEKLTEGIERMVRDYNNMSDARRKNTMEKERAADDALKTGLRSKDRTDIFNKEGMKDKLTRLGLEYDSSKDKLSVNQERLNEAMNNPDELRKSLGGTNGVAANIKKAAHKELGESMKEQFSNRLSFKPSHKSGSNNSWSNNKPVLARTNLYGFNTASGSPISYQ